MGLLQFRAPVMRTSPIFLVSNRNLYEQLLKVGEAQQFPHFCHGPGTWEGLWYLVLFCELEMKCLVWSGGWECSLQRAWAFHTVVLCAGCLLLHLCSLSLACAPGEAQVA